MKVEEMNILVLAYLGDTVYEQFVRKHFIYQGIAHVKDLQNRVIPVVQAKGQAQILERLLKEEFFHEEELSVIYRARNAKGHSHPKNCDILTYKHATALEAVIGYLSILEKQDRIDEMMNKILEELI